MLSILGRARGERRRRLPAGVAAGIGALVLAAGLAASAPAAHAATSGYIWMHNNLRGQLVLGGTAFGSGSANSEEPGTSPAVAPVGNPLSPSGWDDAWVSGSGDVMVNELFFDTVDVGPAKVGTSPDWGLGMTGGTSPAITLVGGANNYEVAFEATNGDLWTVGWDFHGDWGSFIGFGSSPAIMPA